MNWYAYTANNPVNHVDPFGLKLDLTEAGSLLEALKRVRQTERGAAIFETLEKLRDTYNIREGKGRELSYYDPGKRTMVINPSNLPVICTTAGRKPASVERALAHEGGHALGYPGDDEQLEMINVRLNENPVARALGQPERIKYRCP